MQKYEKYCELCSKAITKNCVESVGKFEGRLDRYKGVTVESTSEPCSPHQLAEKLSISLEDWRREGVRTVWFFVSPKDSAWIPLLVGEGFTFHHANSERLALMLWLGNEADTGRRSFDPL